MGTERRTAAAARQRSDGMGRSYGSMPRPSKNELGPRGVVSLNSMVANTFREAMGLSMNRADLNYDNMAALYETFGYKYRLMYTDFARRYRRQDIAKRIVNAIVDHTWKDMPDVRDESDSEQDTRFESDVKKLIKKFKLIKQIKRADKLACIGRYSVIVIGDKYGRLDKPMKTDMQSIDDIAFVSVYSENQARITQYYTDTSNEKFGKPQMYTINTVYTEEEDRGVGTNGAAEPAHSIQVHESHIVHVVDELLESQVFGVPKLESVMNLLDDLIKVCGGGAEMFWLGAYQGLVFNVKDNWNLTEEDGKAMTKEIEKYVAKVQRFIKTKGIEVTTLGSSVSSPQYHFDMLIKLVAGATGIPQRILLGNEAGQLASSADQDNFFSYINSRRNDFGEETVLRPLIDRLIEVGALSKPQGDGEYEVIWPPLFELTPTDRATNAQKIADAAQKMSATGDATEVITKEEFREEFLGLKPQPQVNEDVEDEEESDQAEEDALDGLPYKRDPSTAPPLKPTVDPRNPSVTQAPAEDDAVSAQKPSKGGASTETTNAYLPYGDFRGRKKKGSVQSRTKAITGKRVVRK